MACFSRQAQELFTNLCQINQFSKKKNEEVCIEDIPSLLKQYWLINIFCNNGVQLLSHLVNNQALIHVLMSSCTWKVTGRYPQGYCDFYTRSTVKNFL